MSKLILGACALLAVVAVGCGGDDDEGLSKAEFLKQGNAICKEGDEQIDAAAEESFGGGGEPSDAEIAQFGEETVVPEIQSQIDGLGDLEPPSDDEETITELLDGAQSALDEIEADPTLFTGDEDPFEEVNRQAEDYGLTECAG